MCVFFSHADELYMALVFSKKSHAKLVSVDVSTALEMPGVHSYVDHRDIPDGGSNLTGPVIHDEDIFAAEKVIIISQIKQKLNSKIRTTIRSRTMCKSKYSPL